MKSIVYIVSLISAISVCIPLSAQEPTNMGTDFWVGYGHHSDFETPPPPVDPAAKNEDNLVLYFSAEGQAADVTVTINKLGWTRTYHVEANTVKVSDPMPNGRDASMLDCRLWRDAGLGGSEGLFPKHGIHIHSTAPIVAYAHIIAPGSSGAAMLMPVDTWGYSYMSLNSNQMSGRPLNYSWAYVIASHDNTRVEIIPTVPTHGGMEAGKPFYITLNEGEIYQVLAKKIGLPANDRAEMSGSRFKSVDNGSGQCYPIAVFSGSSATTGNMTCGNGFLEADMQQVFPTHAWGKRYLTAPTSREDNPTVMAANSYKILVGDPATQVKVNGNVLTGMKTNFYYFESKLPALIEADKPIMVAQFLPGGSGTSSCNGSNPNSDPDMIYLSPVDQGINRIGFYRNNQAKILTHYLTLLVPNKGTGLSSLTIDGKPLAGLSATELYTYVHPRMPDYTVVVRRWSGFFPPPADPPGQCLVYSDSAFTAVTYGLGNAESYAYNAGTHIYNLDARSSIRNTLSASTQPNAFTCVNAPVSIFALVAYKPTKIIWKTSALAAALSPAADVTDNAPVPDGTVEINGGIYYKYSLPGTYRFSAADTFYLPVVLESPEVEKCDHSEELKLRIIVKAQPQADYSFTRSSDCALDTVYFTGTDKSIDGYTLQAWNWNFPDSKTAAGKEVKQVLAAGAEQAVALSAVTVEGCVADTIKKIVVYAPPKADFTASPAAICEKGTYTYTGTATYEGTGGLQWIWVTGNGNTQTTTVNTTKPETYTKGGEYKVKLVVKRGALCASDTIIKTVVVYGAPAIDIVYPEGCLPKDGRVVFTNNSIASGGQTITAHAWDFGDADATLPDNPNTATVASPSHIYKKYDKYTIRYQATSSKGCTADTVIKAEFNLAPLFSYNSLDAVCANAAAVTIAKATVTNGVAGTGIYKGPGTSTDGMFTPSVAGAGIHTLWYVFNAKSGCIDSVKQTIEVYPTPQAAFTFNNNACVGDATTFTSGATITGTDAITKWSWSFGDAAKADKTTAAAFGHTYAAYGNYTASLTATSSHNCVSQPATQQVVIQPLPVAGFLTPDTICMPGGAAVFTNKSTIPSNGTLSYRWDFGDETGTSTAVNPSHVYAAAGSYNVQLTAASDYGCRNAVSQTANRFSGRPVAAFTVAPAEICQGGNVTFTDASTASGSTVAAWSWNLGNGSTSVAKAPTATYTTAGKATATLVVKNAQGCISYPATGTVTVHQQPVIDAGVSFMVKDGDQVQFTASANSGNYQFQWLPVTGLSNATVLQPLLKVKEDMLYTLTATGEFGCTASDTMSVKLLRDIVPPNAFTPNGDGIHDVWEIPYLNAYTGAVVTVYNRYGQNVYRSTGYSKPWDGKMNGKDVPSGTYYYVINLGAGIGTLTGPVTIIR